MAAAPNRIIFSSNRKSEGGCCQAPRFLLCLFAPPSLARGLDLGTPSVGRLRRHPLVGQGGGEGKKAFPVADDVCVLPSGFFLHLFSRNCYTWLRLAAWAEGTFTIFALLTEAGRERCWRACTACPETTCSPREQGHLSSRSRQAGRKGFKGVFFFLFKTFYI